MLAFEGISRPAMVEIFDIKLQQNKVLPVMFGVAGYAFQARTGLNVVGGVQAFSRRDAGTDFTMAGGATKGWLSGGEFVAGSAIGWSIQGLVRAGKCAR